MGKNRLTKEWCWNPAYLFKRKSTVKSLHTPFTKLVLRDIRYLSVDSKTLKALEYYIEEYP